MSAPSYEVFVGAVAHIAQISVDAINPNSLLLQDLDFDSMDAIELLALIVEYGGVEVPVDADWESLSVQDVYIGCFVPIQP